MAKKKITQNVNKDAGLLDLPKVKVPHSKWKSQHSNYLTCNIGDIVPIYVDEVLPDEERSVTMGMLSHMTTPIAPIFNAQYTELRSFFIPYRLCADLLAGYKTRKSPWVKVFGEDNASSNANVVVSLTDQHLPYVNSALAIDFKNNLKTFGGLADSLDYEFGNITASGGWGSFFNKLNFLDFAAYELVYQKAYRNQNRESATNSDLYKYLFDIYNRQNSNTISYANCDDFHVANREKDYFTGSQPFTQRSSSPVQVGLAGEADVNFKISATASEGHYLPKFVVPSGGKTAGSVLAVNNSASDELDSAGTALELGVPGKLYADLSSASGINIEDLRVMIKTQELLEKDMLYGVDYASQLNAHFGCAPMSLVLEEPLELKKVTITSQMQPIFQTSTTASEPSILGTIGANATTQTGEFEIVPKTKFREHGLLMICAVHKAQNSYDAIMYKPKRIFKHERFDFYTPELNDLGYQSVTRKEFAPTSYDPSKGWDEAVSFNEAFAEYRYKFNRVHGMFQPSRANALSYWTLSCSGYTDIASLYKQSVTELNRAISVTSINAPQFFDAYGFVEINDKPMSLHSIPGMDGVI